MPAPKWTKAQRDQALELYREHGPAEASRRCGIPTKTISSWAGRTGVRTDAPSHTDAAVRAAAMRWADRRLRLADKLGQLAETLADRAFDAEPRDAKWLADAADRAVSNAQLLSGAATSRSEHDVRDPAARLAVVAELRGKAGERLGAPAEGESA